MRLAIPLALLILAIVGDFVLALQFGVYQRYPWLHILVALAAIAWLAFEATKRFRESWKKAITASLALIVAIGLASIYIWYSLDYSTYGRTEAAVVGQTLDELRSLRLENQRGENVALLEADTADRKTLIVLYRGYW